MFLMNEIVEVRRFGHENSFLRAPWPLGVSGECLGASWVEGGGQKNNTHPRSTESSLLWRGEFLLWSSGPNVFFSLAGSRTTSRQVIGRFIALDKLTIMFVIVLCFSYKM